MGKAKKIKVSKKDVVKSTGPLGEQILKSEFAVPAGRCFIIMFNVTVSRFTDLDMATKCNLSILMSVTEAHVIS
jgi:hypothetical protein